MKELLSRSGELCYYLMGSKDSPREFYADMGWIFASAEIRKDLDDYPINNDGDRLWIVAMEGEMVVGFRSFGFKNDTDAVFFDAWVRPERRGNGVYRKMLDLALKHVRKGGRICVTAIANANSLPALTKAGFKETRRRGKFAYLRLDMTEEARR